jgi:hypothetical protein
LKGMAPDAVISQRAKRQSGAGRDDVLVVPLFPSRQTNRRRAKDGKPSAFGFSFRANLGSIESRRPPAFRGAAVALSGAPLLRAAQEMQKEGRARTSHRNIFFRANKPSPPNPKSSQVAGSGTICGENEMSSMPLSREAGSRTVVKSNSTLCPANIDTSP